MIGSIIGGLRQIQPIAYTVTRRTRTRRLRKGPGGHLSRASSILSLLGLLIVVVFTISRLLTDQYEWSQWIWWTPAWWFVLLAWMTLLGSVLFGWSCRKRGGKKRGRTIRLLLLIGCIGMILNTVFGTWRYQNMLGGYGINWTRAANDDRVRVVHWNIAAGEFDVPQAIQWIDHANADIVLLANPRFDGQRATLTEGLNAIAGEHGTVRRLARAMVMSKFEIIHTSMIYLSTDAEDQSDTAIRPTGGFGWIALLTLDRNQDPDADPQPFDIWFVDLPSEPTAHRMESMHTVVEQLQAIQPPQSPALIIGDFNTVRASASLKQLDEFASTDGFVDAFKARGSLGGSWRPNGLTGIKGLIAEHSSWHIDLSLVGNGWSTNGYELATPDGAEWGTSISHKAQAVDISTNE